MSQVSDRPVMQKYPYVRSRRLLDSSRGQSCTLRFVGCTNERDTVVAAHANYSYCGKGGKIKASDAYSVDACAHCHDILDGRKPSPYDAEEVEQIFWRAFVLTLNRRIQDGLVVIK